MHADDEKHIRNSDREISKSRDDFGDLGIEGRIILKFILMKQTVTIIIGLKQLSGGHL
jgi:hypothetical protein